MGVPHRLDRPVSGVTLFAKTSKALERLNEMLRKGEVHKTYWALTAGKPPKTSDTLTDYLTRNEAQNKSYVSKNGKWKWSSTPAATTRFVANWPTWAVPSKETSNTGQNAPIRTAASACWPAGYNSSTPSKRPRWM